MLLYNRELIGETEVTVAVTPNGYADAVNKGKFVMPEERILTFSSFLDILEKKVEANGVFYVQKQNSNLTDEFDALSDDVEPHIPWATKVFGQYCKITSFGCFFILTDFSIRVYYCF